MKDTRLSLSRRTMLIATGAVAAMGTTIAAPADAANPAPRGRGRTPRSGGRPLASAGHDEWAAEVGSTFAVAGAQRLTLAEVRPFESAGPRPAGARDRAFVAQFDVAGSGTITRDGIYTVTHPRHGPFQMFLTAGGDANPRRLQAVFN